MNHGEHFDPFRVNSVNDSIVAFENLAEITSARIIFVLRHEMPGMGNRPSDSVFRVIRSTIRMALRGESAAT